MHFILLSAREEMKHRESIGLDPRVLAYENLPYIIHSPRTWFVGAQRAKEKLPEGIVL